MFTVEQRVELRDRILEIARGDRRVVAAAEIGSLTDGGGDRWSDLDLTFGVLDDVDLLDVLNEWTAQLTNEFAAVHIFDLPSGSTIYRVLLFPGALQVDLSLTSAAEFGPHDPFRPIFGKVRKKEAPTPPSIGHLFGLGAHHVVRARICIERGRLWQAEYWISAIRDQALSIACARRSFSTTYGRGFDQLPSDVLDSAEASLVRSLTRDDLLQALRNAIGLLVRESREIEPAKKLSDQLRELGSSGPLT